MDELELGTIHEAEHNGTLKHFFPHVTSEQLKEIAKAVAQDHLKEDPKYYSRLKEMEHGKK